MLKTAQAFIDELTRVGLKYKASQEVPGGKHLVVCGVNGKNNARYDVLFIFDEDADAVSIRILKLLECPEERTLKMLDAINELNAQYRWYKFYLDKEQNLDVQLDAYIDEGNAGRTCVMLLLRLMKIIDDCYPRLMQALWA